MLRRLLSSSSAALSVWLVTSAVGAAEWIPVADSPARGGGAVSSARAHLAESSDHLRLDGVVLHLERDLAVGAHRTVRFSQLYAGLPVLGGAAAVRVDAAGRVKLVVLEVARGLAAPTTPLVSRDTAVAIGRGRAGASAPANASRLAVLPDGKKGKLVWSLDFASSLGGSRLLVDADSGAIVSERPLARHAKGRVYEISSVVTPTPIDIDLPDLVPAAPQKLTGHAGQLTVFNYVSGTQQDDDFVVAQDLVPNSGEDFLYDPPVDPKDATDGFAQVGVYYHLSRMRSYFTTTFALDMSAPSWALAAVSNLKQGSQPVDNAYFSQQGLGPPWNIPNMVAIGQGSAFDFADDSDVFLHEFTHYVSHNAVDYNEGQFATNEYGRTTFGGSIDEGISDYFACTENDDPLLGEASLGKFGLARDLTKTGKVCPDDIVGETHEDGEIIGSTGWTLRTKLGQDAADQLVWGAVSLLVKGASFGDFGRGLVQTANDLVADGMLATADVTELEDVLATRGLDDCDHSLAIDADDPTRVTQLNGLDYIAQFFGGTCQEVKDFGIDIQSLFHFETQPDPAATGIRFRVDLDTVGPDGELDWAIYARRGEHVGFEAMMFGAEVSDYDYVVEGITAATGGLVIDATSDPPFDPASSYHMVIIHKNCPVTVATVSVEQLGLPMGAGGGGGSGGDGSGGATAGAGGAPVAPKALEAGGGGCDCRTAGRSTDDSSGAFAALAALAALLARRSRRRD